MAKYQILVVEDDAAIRQGIVDALTFEGYEPLQAADGNDGLTKALQFSYDLMLLDLVLPGREGLEILKELRVARPTVPVIILTAKGEEKDRVAGLKLGADDYMVKPFSIKELLARVEAVLRRSPARPSDTKSISVLGRTIDLERSEILLPDGTRETLSEREAELIGYLARRSGHPISREEILAHVWRIDAKGVETRTIDMHVARLREKLQDNAGQPEILQTVRGKGYLFAAEEAS